MIYDDKRKQNLLNKINSVSDIVILFISMTLAYIIRFYVFSPDTDYIRLATYIEFSVVIIPINLIILIFSTYIILLEQPHL